MKLNKLNKEARDSIKKSFFNGKLLIKSLNTKTNEVSWQNVGEVMKHHTPHKNIFNVSTGSGDIGVTEDHSLFKFEDKIPIITSELHIGDKIVGKDNEDNVIPLDITKISQEGNEEFTYDISVPKNENFFTASGILAHNSYSVSGVSLDIEKSSKYQSMKESFETEYDKILEQAKRSIKIAVGLKQPRYGIGISSALGPLSKPGTQSRRNFVSGFRGGWA